MGCDKCHFVAVIGPSSRDINSALQRLRAAPLDLTVVNTTLWSWSEGSFRASDSQRPTALAAATHREEPTPSHPGRLQLSAESQDGMLDGRLPWETLGETQHQPGGALDG
jgi:hypothetical protein